VWWAASAGNCVALEAALAAGGSTEEIQRSERNLKPAPPPATFTVPCHLSQVTNALGCASQQGHVEAVRILLAAGADVNAEERVSLRTDAVFQ